MLFYPVLVRIFHLQITRAPRTTTHVYTDYSCITYLNLWYIKGSQVPQTQRSVGQKSDDLWKIAEKMTTTLGTKIHFET